MTEDGIHLRRYASDGNGSCWEALTSDSVVVCVQLQVTENPTQMGLTSFLKNG